MKHWFGGLLFMVAFSGCWHPKKNSTMQKGRAENVDSGRLLYNASCKSCHGENAEGKIKFQAPALANSNDWYLYRQLMNYRTGIRGYDPHDIVAFQMAAMAKTVSDTLALQDIVAYIKILPGVKVETAKAGDIKNGKSIYQGVCGACHGANAEGNQKLNAPQLSGLNDWYLKDQIFKFKKSIRGAHPRDKFGAQMMAMAAMLPDDQSIDDVIAYMQAAKLDSK